MSGFKELDKLLRQLPPRIENRVLQKSVTQALKDEALPGLRAAAPRDDDGQSPASQRYGRLFGNIKVRVSKRDRKKGQRGAFITTGQSFWGFLLERGTRYISAKPWFEPSITASEANIFEKLRILIAEGIEKEAKK